MRFWWRAQLLPWIGTVLATAVGCSADEALPWGDRPDVGVPPAPDSGKGGREAGIIDGALGGGGREAGLVDVGLVDVGADGREAGSSDASLDREGGSDGALDGGTFGPCNANDPLRMVFFGDLHVHTSFSGDAYELFGTRLNPDDAYGFAKGNPVTIPAGTDGSATTITIDRPLDFVAVTDHSEWLSPETGSLESVRPPLPDVARDAWIRTIDSANRALEGPPACRFTSFIAYEWSASPGNTAPIADPTFDLRSRFVWRHRNVIFATDTVPDVPINALEVPVLEDLFSRLRTLCTDLPGGVCDVMTIPHNSNYSQGVIFEVDANLTATQARERAEMEPLVEIFQVKGNSECKTGVDNDDPDCRFETLGQPVCTGQDAGTCQPLCGDPGAPAGVRCEEPLSYVRNALKSGVSIEKRIGENPLKLGFIGSTDNHNALPGAVAEHDYIGAHGTDDGDAQDRLQTWMQYSVGGLAGVWAEENSRSALFAALKRRETYGTSGPRMIVRFFGGWSFPQDMCQRTDLVAQGYGTGVPMGSDLPPRPSNGATPMFVAWAARDLGTASRPGTFLQQLQIIKGWVDDAGTTHEKVFTIAGDPNNGASVDTSTCTPQGPGSDELCTLWSDPEYSPTEHAFYYARVIENPSCRYSAYDCARLPAADRPSQCTDGSVPLAIQERAWTSPIWTRP